MAVHAEPRAGFAAETGRLRLWAVPMALLLVIALAIPMLTSKAANLTSDESLYVAEAYSIAHGHGVTYPSGEAVTHRPPLFPLVLAPAVRLGGPEAAYRVTRLIVLANAIVLMLLVWRTAGSLAGAMAGAAAAASAYLNGLGTSLYLDPLLCTFMLLSLAALNEAVRSERAHWFIAAGAALGLAFLVKESAIQWAPLGVLAWLAVPSLRSTFGARGALAFTLAFAAAIAPWWIWVWVQTSELFMLGSPTAVSVGLLAASAVGLGLFAIAIRGWPALGSDTRHRIATLAPGGAAALVVAWGAFMIASLTRYATWPYPNDYLHSIPRYLNTVAPEAQPYLLLGAAWCGIVLLAARRHEHARLMACAALLYAPFALFGANRGLQLRDALPLVYLSYAAFGIAGAALIGLVRRRIAQPIGDVLLAAALIAFGAALTLQQTTTFWVQNDGAAAVGVRADSWENPFEQHIAGWLDANLTPGSRILSSRLYFSSLYVDTGGRFSIRQMPTVRVDVDPAHPALLASRSNLFRWGDEGLRANQLDDQWLYLQQFPVKGYWVGLNQQELLDDIARNDIDYVILTGQDAAFSSLAYADYFVGHPAFSLRYHAEYSPTDQLFVFDVNRAKLQPRTHSTAITPASMNALTRETGLDSKQLSAALGTPLRVTDSDRGLSDREQQAAMAGVDLDADE